PEHLGPREDREAGEVGGVVPSEGDPLRGAALLAGTGRTERRRMGDPDPEPLGPGPAGEPELALNVDLPSDPGSLPSQGGARRTRGDRGQRGGRSRQERYRQEEQGEVPEQDRERGAERPRGQKGSGPGGPSELEGLGPAHVRRSTSAIRASR